MIDETFSQANQNVVLSCEATFNTFSYRDTNNSYSVEWVKGSRPVGEVYPLNGRVILGNYNITIKNAGRNYSNKV